MVRGTGVGLGVGVPAGVMMPVECKAVVWDSSSVVVIVKAAVIAAGSVGVVVEVVAASGVKVGAKVAVGECGVKVGVGEAVLVWVGSGVGVVVWVAVGRSVGVVVAVAIAIVALVGVLVGVAVEFKTRAFAWLIKVRPATVRTMMVRAIPKPRPARILVICWSTVGNSKRVTPKSRLY